MVPTMIIMDVFEALIPQNGQTHSNNSSPKADELFACVWPFCGIGA